MYSHLIFLVSRKVDTMLADGHAQLFREYLRDLGDLYNSIELLVWTISHVTPEGHRVS